MLSSGSISSAEHLARWTTNTSDSRTETGIWSLISVVSIIPMVSLFNNMHRRSVHSREVLKSSLAYCRPVFSHQHRIMVCRVVAHIHRNIIDKVMHQIVVHTLAVYAYRPLVCGGCHNWRVNQQCAVMYRGNVLHVIMYQVVIHKFVREYGSRMALGSVDHYHRCFVHHWFIHIIVNIRRLGLSQDCHEEHLVHHPCSKPWN